MAELPPIVVEIDAAAAAEKIAELQTAADKLLATLGQCAKVCEGCKLDIAGTLKVPATDLVATLRTWDYRNVHREGDSTQGKELAGETSYAQGPVLTAAQVEEISVKKQAGQPVTEEENRQLYRAARLA